MHLRPQERSELDAPLRVPEQLKLLEVRGKFYEIIDRHFGLRPGTTQIASELLQHIDGISVTQAHNPTMRQELKNKELKALNELLKLNIPQAVYSDFVFSLGYYGLVLSHLPRQETEKFPGFVPLGDKRETRVRIAGEIIDFHSPRIDVAFIQHGNAHHLMVGFTKEGQGDLPAQRCTIHSTKENMRGTFHSSYFSFAQGDERSETRIPWELQHASAKRLGTEAVYTPEGQLEWFVLHTGSFADQKKAMVIRYKDGVVTTEDSKENAQIWFDAGLEIAETSKEIVISFQGQKHRYPLTFAGEKVIDAMMQQLNQVFA